jgi:hypothetical protein
VATPYGGRWRSLPASSRGPSGPLSPRRIVRRGRHCGTTQNGTPARLDPYEGILLAFPSVPREVLSRRHGGFQRAELRHFLRSEFPNFQIFPQGGGSRGKYNPQEINPSDTREPHLNRGPTYGANATHGGQSINTSRARVLLARVHARTTPRWNVYAAESLRGASRLLQHLCRQAKHKNVPYHPHVTQRLVTKPNLSMHLVRLSEHKPCSINTVSPRTHTLLGVVSITMLT